MSDSQRELLESFATAYGGTQDRSRFSILITPRSSNRTYKVTALGVLPAKRELIISSLLAADGGVIAGYQGLTLQCNWVSASTLFRFDAVITKVVLEPQPMLYLRLSDQTQHRPVRTVPRALVSLLVELRLPQEQDALLVDLSTSGARVAMFDDPPVAAGGKLELSIKPKLHLDLDLQLVLKCTVVGEAKPALPEFPSIVFRGLQFNEVAERDLLVLHAYVQQNLVDELDSLANVLLSARELREIKVVPS
ncbi:MAG: PilZ domain-containing protein [Steroidobacteraceae bacterium]